MLLPSYSRWPYMMRVCVTKNYPHYTGHPHYVKTGHYRGSILCQTISPAQYRTPALHRATYCTRTAVTAVACCENGQDMLGCSQNQGVQTGIRYKHVSIGQETARPKSWELAQAARAGHLPVIDIDVNRVRGKKRGGSRLD